MSCGMLRYVAIYTMLCGFCDVVCDVTGDGPEVKKIAETADYSADIADYTADIVDIANTPQKTADYIADYTADIADNPRFFLPCGVSAMSTMSAV